MAKAPTTKTTATPSTTPTAPAAGEGVSNPINAPVVPTTAESGTTPTKPTEGDSTHSTGAIDQAGESQSQQPQGESGVDRVGSGATDQLAPATAESGTVPTAPTKPTEDDSTVLKAQAESLDLWVHNKGVFSKTEPRSKMLLGAGKTTHIQISSVAMRQTVERNIEQMNHLNGGRLLVLVDQPVAPEPEEGS